MAERTADADDETARLRSDLEYVLRKGLRDFDPERVSVLKELWAGTARGVKEQRAAVRRALTDLLDPDGGDDYAQRSRRDDGLAGLFMFGAFGRVEFPADGPQPAVILDPEALRLSERLKSLAQLRGESDDAIGRKSPRGSDRTLRQMVMDQLVDEIQAIRDNRAGEPPMSVSLGAVHRAVGERAEVFQIDNQTGRNAGERLRAAAHRLGVRRAPRGDAFGVPVDASTAPRRLSRYIRRDGVDAPLESALARSFHKSGVYVIALEGLPFTGKTRAMLHALSQLERGYRFLAPADTSQLSGILTAPHGYLHPQRPTFIWLDPLESFWEPNGGPWASNLERFSERAAPIVILTTVGGTGGVSTEAPLRRFLALDHPLDLLRDLCLVEKLEIVELRVSERGFEGAAARAEIRATYDAGAASPPGHWERAAIEGGFLRALTHGHELELRYLGYGPRPADPRGQAVAWAVMAWRRALQRSDPINLATIERLVPHSPLGSRAHIGSEAQLCAAVDWACETAIDGVSGLATRIRLGHAEAFRAEGVVAHALVNSSELTPEVWEIIRSAVPASRLAIVNASQVAAALAAYGSIRSLATPTDVVYHRPIDTRGPDDRSDATEPTPVTSVTFEARGYSCRLKAVNHKVSVGVRAGPATEDPVAVAARLTPPPNSDDSHDPSATVAMGYLNRGRCELSTSIAAPRTDQDWAQLVHSFSLAGVG